MSEELHIPSGLNYGCIQCGESCRMFNEVAVEERSRGKLEAINCAELMAEELRGLPYLVQSPTEKAKQILRRHEGTCVFQTSEGLCGVHKKHGFGQKPQTCQDFPYRFAETPAGTFVGLSFACTAVLQNTGTPLMEQREQLAEHHPRANSVRDCREAVRLTHRHEVSWGAYEALEEDLLAIQRTAAQPFGVRLVAQSMYIDLYASFLRETRDDSIRRRNPALPHDLAGSGRFRADSGVAPDTEVLSMLRRRYLPGDGHRELFRLATRPRSSPALQRAFLGMVIAYRQSLDHKGEKATRLGAITKICRHYLPPLLKLGSVHIEPLKASFEYAEFSRIRYPLEESEALVELMQRYLDHTLFRKDLLGAESVWLGQRFMLMHFALARWYATGRASIGGLGEVDEQCLREAIRFVELHYLTHTRFASLFERFPMLGTIIDAVMRKPSFAASMICPAV